MADSGILMDFNLLCKATGGDLHCPGDTTGYSGFSSVSIDSRAVKEGSLFVALPGERSDGHDFVKEAFSNGAVAAIVERKKYASLGLQDTSVVSGKTVIAVDDTLAALQSAAKLYLEKFPSLLKIGITGSAGKTTTKEMAAAIIGCEKNTVANPGNFNSDSGLSLSVFAVRPCHEVGIFEMGMNRKGEMADLAGVLNPDIALITNIGSAHIGILGSKQAIAKEKKNIFSRLGEKGIALIPEDSGFRDFLAEDIRGKVSFYGEESIAGLGGCFDRGLNGSEIVLDGQSINLALPGRHNLANAVAAIAIAQKIPVSTAAVKKGLESVKPLFGRGEIMHGSITVVRDCYNSNLESLTAAINFCDSVEWPGRRIYVIGEMLELGDASHGAHVEMGRLLAASKADAVYFFGKETGAALEAFTSCPYENGAKSKVRFFHTCDMEELMREAGSFACRGDLVLLKGSRGCALERLCAVFEKEDGSVSGNI